MIDVYLGAVPRVPRVVAGHSSQHLLTPRAHCQGPARVSLTCDDVMSYVTVTCDDVMSQCYQEHYRAGPQCPLLLTPGADLILK